MEKSLKNITHGSGMKMKIELLAFEKQFLVPMQGKTLGDWGHQQTKTKLQYVGRIPHLFPCQR